MTFSGAKRLAIARTPIGINRQVFASILLVFIRLSITHLLSHESYNFVGKLKALTFKQNYSSTMNFILIAHHFLKEATC